MTEHFTREEAVALASTIAEDEDYEFNLINDAITAKLKEWEAQGAVAWFAFADSNGPVPLELYGWDEKACKHAVLTNARSVGWKGTVDGYLYEQRWTIKPVFTHALPAQHAEPEILACPGMPQGMGNEPEFDEPANAELVEALKFYAEQDHFMRYNEDAWDTVSGEPQNFWEDENGNGMVEDGSIARAALTRAQAAQPVVAVPDATHLNNLRNAVNIFQSFVNGRTSHYLAQVSINALNEYLDAATPLPQQKEGV